MSFKKAEVNNYLLCDTSIENVFISEFAKNAPGEYVKLYLLAYMYMEIGKPIDDNYLAKALGTSVKDVSDGWTYWQNMGIVNLEKKDGHNEIEFICIKDKLLSRGSGGTKTNKGPAKLQNEKLAELIRNIEQVSGKLLDAKETETVFNWVNSFVSNPEIILEAYKLCVKKNLSTSFRYVEKILVDWNGKGLDTLEKVKEYLEDTDRHYSFYRKVFNELGFKRNPTKPEMDMMDTWMDDLDCTEDDLKKAIGKTTGITNPNLNYINTVLVSEKNAEKNKSGAFTEKETISIDRLYEKIRQENEKKTKAKRSLIYSKVPGLEKACNELLEINKKITMSFVTKGLGAEDIQGLRERQQALQAQKTKMLAGAGYTEEDLNPIYTCRKCEDTGILEDGRRCSCFLDRMSEI